jgi:pyruvate/2-oxoacid:ferredoxin oxidoreductase alpha subunit
MKGNEAFALDAIPVVAMILRIPITPQSEIIETLWNSNWKTTEWFVFRPKAKLQSIITLFTELQLW